ncbi:MAG: hypothetical protein AAFQ63_01950 [Cyanobacteria bacterium J06621_11]
MTQIHINTDITLNAQQLLKAVSQLNTDELEAFHTGVSSLLKSRQQEKLPQQTHLRQNTSGSASLETIPSPLENTDTNPSLPIVAALIPKSLTLDGSDISL